MPWHVTDYENVKFNQDDTGWLVLSSIHTAIKERAEFTQHSLMASYTGDFDTTVWLGDPDGDTDRVYLKDVLNQFYTDIDTLVYGDADVRWTEAAGAGTLWTTASLTTDIGMGDFADLLTRAANPEPFMWLQAALDRLIYPRCELRATADSATLVYTGSGGHSGPSYTLQTAWDNRANFAFLDPYHPTYIQLFWRENPAGFPFFGYAATIRTSATGAEYKTSLYGGELVESYYNYEAAFDPYFTLSSLDFYVGTTFFSVTDDASGSALTTDFALGADTYIDAYIDTAEPATTPFSAATAAIPFGGTELYIGSVYLHTDLTSVLTDQS